MTKQEDKKGSKSKNTAAKTRNPMLPALPEELVSNYPACSGKARWLMFLAALPISLVVGVIAHFIGVGLVFIGVWISEYIGFFSVMLSGVFFLGYPFFVGMVNHEVVEFLGKKDQCRDRKTTKFAGLVNGFPLYLGHVLMSFLIAGQMIYLGYSSDLIRSFDSRFAADLDTGGVFIILLHVLQFALLLLGSYIGTPDKERDDLFCKKHKAVYGYWEEKRYPAAMISRIEQRITKGVPLQGLREVNLNTYPRLHLYYRCCQSDDNCDVQIKAVFWWREEHDFFIGAPESEVWFDAMLQGELGHAIMDELGLKPSKYVRKYHWFY